MRNRIILVSQRSKKIQLKTISHFQTYTAAGSKKWLKNTWNVTENHFPFYTAKTEFKIFICEENGAKKMKPTP